MDSICLFKSPTDLRFKITTVKPQTPQKCFKYGAKKSYFALKHLKSYFSVLKTCFSDLSSHLGIKNDQEHPPTPSELGDRGLRTLSVDHKSQLSFVKYNGGGLRNPGTITDLELTPELLRPLSQSSDGVGRCSWAFPIPK